MPTVAHHHVEPDLLVWAVGTTARKIVLKVASNGDFGEAPTGTQRRLVQPWKYAGKIPQHERPLPENSSTPPGFWAKTGTKSTPTVQRELSGDTPTDSGLNFERFNRRSLLPT